ncbi:MAG: aminopeptidase [Gemmatimonadota bacterium]|jgi:aminopeptidase|nr:aminopeptidase [Gemmatimonadota bacterium]MDP6461752.1 aminopeptidase [Gemmatimonadota bacterium]MDP6528486.1 aminopeptidase [Gemmatimonadota bacterium]MDP6803005.1 aminopeptidase [Gemmatimonadota bacterium]MDP7032268.1 aminopeptidase [Gemmatimonadota bacterium]
MVDPRNTRLAESLVQYSMEIAPGDNVLLDFRGTETIDLMKEVVTAVTEAGGTPHCLLGDDSINRRFLRSANESQVEAAGAVLEKMMREMQAYIRVNGTHNPFDLSDIPEDALKWDREQIMERVHLKIRVPGTKWVVLRFPGNAMAQMAKMSREAFADLYYNVCTLDYGRMSRAMDPLVALMERTDKVRLTAKDTDVTLSIKDIGVVKCDGRRNIPDGEVFTAPVRDSVDGVVTYNAGALYSGTSWDWIRLTFEKGRIAGIDASNDVEKLRKIFSTDEGASFVGEFAFGLNPYLDLAIKDTLFDEKIYGSFHTALGQCYDTTENGNRSSIHWDLVCIQTPEYGGGSVWFDGELVREDGEWVHPDLKATLSREALTGEETPSPEPVG